MKVLITAEQIRQYHRNGDKVIDIARENTIITPEAKDVAKKLSIEFREVVEPAVVHSTDAALPKQASPEPSISDQIRSAVETKLKPGSCNPELVNEAIAKVLRELDQPEPYCEREVGNSGVILVRGGSVQFGRFDGVKDHPIGLTDVVTASDNSPIAAGYMQWEKCTFPWTLDYDEVDVVLEGELHITAGGQTHVGKPGDVFFIPKGTSLEFGTPDKVRFVYVTYPADWM
ncbi:MAG: ethanolamine utilization acetate kinase EutQ [Proteobacteria bacterium]|nr:MAG: ethanolamine utilization acetate kinase EutQ [Pseudomonadota bacterium]